MPLCIFEGCLSGSRSKNILRDPSIHLHSFPKDEKLREKWISQITKGTNIKTINCRTAVVCTKHFSKSDIIEKTAIQKAAGYSPERARRLKVNAIPLSIHGSPYLSTPINYANNNSTKITTPSGTFIVTNEDANKSSPQVSSRINCRRSLFPISNETFSNNDFIQIPSSITEEFNMENEYIK